jgi:hypothetical protein
MKAIDKTARAILDKLTEGLTEPGTSRRIDNAPRPIMRVCVEYVDECPIGPVFSVAHYYEANGDLVPDPDMTFARHRETGDYVPLSIEHCGRHFVGIRWEKGASYVNATQQHDQADFANEWLRNIKEQQGL